MTRWIAANTGAAGVPEGAVRPLGHARQHRLRGHRHRGLQYPTNAFAAQDSYPVIQHRYSPLFPLSLVANYQVENWEPGTSWEKDQTGNFPKDPIQPPGQRALFAILDQADAAAFRFPVAEIPNTAGQYVAPTTSAMAAAVQDMSGNGSGTQQVNLTSKDKAAYPLTMVIYAMVPTSGTKRKQGGGDRPVPRLRRRGRPEGGRAARPASAGLSAAAGQAWPPDAKDAVAVLNQTGATKTPGTTNPGVGSSPSPAPAASPSTSPGGSVSLPRVNPGGEGPPITMVPLAHVSPGTITRYALPALLDPRRARGAGRLVLADRRRPRRGRRQAAPAAPGRRRVGP